MELISSIGPHRDKDLFQLYIVNRGGTHRRGNYSVHLCRRGVDDPPRETASPDHPMHDVLRAAHRNAEVLDYPRLSYHPMELLRRALNALAGKSSGSESIDRPPVALLVYGGKLPDTPDTYDQLQDLADQLGPEDDAIESTIGEGSDSVTVRVSWL